MNGRRNTYIHTTVAGFEEERSKINWGMAIFNLFTMAITGVGFGTVIFYILSGG